MRDLLLWRLLLSGELEGDAVLPLLRELASAPLKQRFPFLGLLGPALSHRDARVRAAALDALGGAEGPLAFPILVRAFDDPDGNVARSAVWALRRSAWTQPARLAHALFHRRPVVRSTAVESELPPGAEPWAFYLLADPECAARVRERVTVPPGALPALLDFARRGVVPEDDARRWIAAMPWDATARWLAGSHRRGPAEVGAVLESEAAKTPGDDALDGLFELFWKADADPEVRRRTFGAFMEALLGGAGLLQRRVVASVLVLARRHGWIAEAAELCAVFHAPFLGYRWVPREVRHAALAGLYRAGARTPRLTDDAVQTLLELDIFRRPTGRLDLWAVGALLHLLRQHPYHTLLDWVGEAAVVAAFVEDPERAAPFLSLHDASETGRRRLIDAITGAMPGRRGSLLALLAHAVHADELDFLEALSGEEALEVAAALLDLEARPGFDFAAHKVQRIAGMLAGPIAGPRPHLPGAAEPALFLHDWLGRREPESFTLGTALLGAISRLLDTDAFVRTCASLDTFLLKRLLAALPYAPSVTYGAELALAHALVGHVSPAVHGWAAERLPPEGEPRPPRRRDGRIALSPAQRRAIASAPEGDLADVLEPCLGTPHTGLVPALAERPDPAHPCLAVCVALLGCHDDPHAVADELRRFGTAEPDFLTALDAAAVRTWQGTADLPSIGHGWLHRFEAHAFALVDALEASEGGLVGALERTPPFVAVDVWRGVARALAIWRWRDRARLAALATESLIDLLVSHLDTTVGRCAADALVAIHHARVAPELVEARRPLVVARSPDYDDDTRRALELLVDATGLPSRSAPLRKPGGPDADLLERVRASADLDALEAWCAHEDERIVHEAVLRLIELGDEGALRLAELLARRPLPPRVRVVADSITLWPDGRALDAVRQAMVAGIDDPELTFRVAVSLVEKGERWWMRDAWAATAVPTPVSWLRPEDWERLDSLATDRVALCCALARSPHPHAYRPAVEHLLDFVEPPDPVREALRDFLDAGTGRMGELRRRAAWRLHGVGDMHAFPLCVTDAFVNTGRAQELFRGVDARLVEAVVDGALLAGSGSAPESLLLPMLDAPHTPREGRDAGLERLLTECQQDGVRQQVVSRLERRPSRTLKLRELAKVFAWGTRTGRELSGRVFRFHMIGGQRLRQGAHRPEEEGAEEAERARGGAGARPGP